MQNFWVNLNKLKIKRISIKRSTLMNHYWRYCGKIKKGFTMWESKQVNLIKIQNFMNFLRFCCMIKKKKSGSEVLIFCLWYLRQPNSIYSCDWLWQSCFIYKPLCNNYYLIKCHFMLFWDNWSNWQRKRRQNSIIIGDEYVLYCKHRDSNK